jgi:hypothetical protein
VPRMITTIQIVAKQLGMPVRLVVVDTLARAMAGGNENGSEDMGALVTSSDQIREQTGACVLYIHHSGKDAAKGSRGHSSLKAATDTEIEVTRGADKVSSARVTKQRDLESEGSFAFRLEPVELGTNQRGKPVMSCVVVAADMPASKGGAKHLPDDAKIMLHALHHTIRDHGIVATVFDHHVEGLVARVEDWRQQVYRMKPDDNQDTKRRAFKRGFDRLFADGCIECLDGFAWPKG